jgi:hypothetical protein
MVDIPVSLDRIEITLVTDLVSYCKGMVNLPVAALVWGMGYVKWYNWDGGIRGSLDRASTSESCSSDGLADNLLLLLFSLTTIGSVFGVVIG